MAASTTWCTSAEVQELLGSHRGFDATLLAVAIQGASAEINTRLRAHGVTPSDVTAAAYPDDEELLNQLCRKGAGAWYINASTGSMAGVESLKADWDRGLRLIEDKPLMLESYSYLVSGDNTVWTHTKDMTDAEVERAKRGIPDPEIDGPVNFRRRF